MNDFSAMPLLIGLGVAQGATPEVAGWIPVLAQFGLAGWMIWWFATKSTKTQEDNTKAIREVAEAMRQNARSNLNVVLALKALDKEHVALQLARDHLAELDEEDRRKRHESVNSGG